MRVTIRGEAAELRSAMSFAFSAVLHGAVLAWIAIGATLITGEKAQSLYDQEIKPHANHIVWYGVRDRLPDVKPAAPKAGKRPLRAVRKFNQQIVSRAQEDARPPQMILAPAPEIRIHMPLPLPNVLAVAAVPRPVRPFVPPRERRIVEPAPAKLPDAPATVAAVPVQDLALGLARPKAPPLPFRAPPEVKRATPAPAVLPAAPGVAATAPRFEPPRIPRAFTPPATKRAPAADLPTDAPAPSPVALPNVRPSLAIVGLRPVELPAIPTPPGSHEAGFSAAVKPQPAGGDSDSKDAALTAPGLLTRGGTKEAQAALVASLASPTSAQSLMEGMRRIESERPSSPLAPAGGALRPSSAPDPRLSGRAVYVMAIQMPNITSDSGSWLVWFAERETQGGTPFVMRPPVPVRKVDPKYIASAREERVEGSIRLFAIIRKTGQVDSVELLQHLDARLDRSAEEALLKWQFEPATRDGVPVDVEAVFQIPFHLKPRETR